MNFEIGAVNIQVILVMIGAAITMQSLTIGVQAWLVRRYHGIRTAAVGSLILAVGFFLLALRDLVPNWLSIVAASVSIMGASACFLVAIRRFHDRAFRWYHLVLTLALSTVGIEFFNDVIPSSTARILIVVGVVITFLGLVIRDVVMVDHPENKVGAYLLILPLGVTCLLLLIYAIAALAAPTISALPTSSLRVWLYCAVFILSFAITSGFSTLVSHRLAADLSMVASADNLTGLANRLVAVTYLEKEFAKKARNSSYCFSILLIDLDRFKQINDEYGHDAGDYTLVTAGNMLIDCVRGQDLVARWGGDEFIIVLPETRTQAAVLLGERLRDQVSRSVFEHGPFQYKLTISVGACGSDLCETIDDIFKRADLALYDAKKHRNSVRGFVGDISVLG